MRKCFVHIGMQKTGSSSIQATWFNNQELIDETFGVHYFSAFENHGLLREIFFDDQDLDTVSANRGLTQKQLETGINRYRTTLENEIKNSAPKPFVLSGEGFSLLDFEQVKRFKQFLIPFFDDIRIVIYVREPFSFMSSMAQEYVKYGLTFDRICKDTYRVLDRNNPKFRRSSSGIFSTVLPLYRFRIEKYQKLFGKKNVYIRPFNRSELLNNDVVSDFAETTFPELGIMNSISPTNKNESINHEATLFIEAMNRKYPYRKHPHKNPMRAENLVDHLKKQTDGQKFQFSALDLDKFKNLISDDVKWLAKTTNGEIDFDLSNPPALDQVTTNNDLLDMCVTISNDLALKEFHSDILEHFFFIMHRFNKGAKFNEAGIKSILKNCELEKDLTTMRNVLRQSGRKAEALLFQEKLAHIRKILKETTDFQNYSENHFGKVARLTNETKRKELVAWQVPAIKNHIGDLTGKVFLDIGAGDLVYGEKLSEIGVPKKFYVQDLSRPSLNAGLERLKTSGVDTRIFHSLISDNFNFDAIEDDELNAAFSNALFAHLSVKSIVLCLQNLSPKMKRGARYFSSMIVVPDKSENLPHDWRDIDNPISKVFSFPEKAPFHYTEKTIKNLQSMRTGFEVVSIHEYGNPIQKLVEFKRV